MDTWYAAYIPALVAGSVIVYLFVAAYA